MVLRPRGRQHEAWFTAHRDTYEIAVRGAFEAMIDELADDARRRVKVFRQHRDIRFSADKSPYKTRTYGVIPDRPDGAPSLYAQVVGDRASSPAPATTSSRATSSPASATRSPTTRPGPRSSRRSPRPRAPGSRPTARRSRPRRAAIRATTRGSSSCATSRSSAARASPRAPDGIGRDAALDHARGDMERVRAAERVARGERRPERAARGRRASAADVGEVVGPKRIDVQTWRVGACPVSAILGSDSPAPHPSRHGRRAPHRSPMRRLVLLAAVSVDGRPAPPPEPARSAAGIISSLSVDPSQVRDGATATGTVDARVPRATAPRPSCCSAATPRSRPSRIGRRARTAPSP